MEQKLITIPVVVHIIYSNDLENISDDQVQSQIDVLNEDFRKTNPYVTDKWPQAADTKIQFRLASVDPNGNSTKGITRKSTTKESWGAQDQMKDSKSGGVDPWNTAEYLNIWVCNIGNGILGYAQYPGGKPSTDGVVINPKYFGSSDKGSNFYLSAPFDKGRTTTHEIGHFLNLRHIWGNSRGCGTDDLVSDTPESNGPNYGCQHGTVSCGSEDMIENFMDYSDDTCMSIFTSGQSARMHAILMEGGFRHELATSNKFDSIVNDLTTPEGIVVSDVQTCEAHISWDEIEGVSYDIRYRILGSETWNQTSVLGTSIVLNELSDDSEYEVKVRSTSESGESLYSSCVKFNTLIKDPYCESKATNVQELYLGTVTLGNINNTSDGGNGYSSFVSQSTKVLKTHAVNFELTPVWTGGINYETGYSIFVDYNQDNDFDDEGETVFIQSMVTDPFVKGSFIIPHHALEGDTRMRIAVKYDGIPKECEVFEYGEVEDYTLKILAADHDTHEPTAPENLHASEIKETAITLSWDNAIDDVNVEGYDVFIDDKFFDYITTASIEIPNLDLATEYKLSVRTVDCSGNESDFSNISVTTIGEAISYCQSRGESVAYEWIDKVEIGEISNESSNDKGYGDYTALTANVIKGSQTPIVVSSGFLNFSYTEFWTVWIDFNQDGSFDDEERVLEGSSSDESDLYGIIDIPTNALLGKTRMRVAMKYNTKALACESFSEGEVEDYTLNIVDLDNAQNLKEADISNANILGNEEEFNVTASPNPATDILDIKIQDHKRNQMVSYTIVNNMGQIVQRNNLNSFKLDVSKLNFGVYILEVYDGQKKFQTKIVKR
ncbi:GEVED domain-containing protein [Tenacibaculum jejuense]|nr:GEVED domain-containing protein [Tenacibaculum jejuense]